MNSPEYYRKHHADNREARNAYSRAWRARNGEHVSEYGRTYNLLHKEERGAYHKSYWEKNKKALYEKKLARNKANPEKAGFYKRRWRAENPHLVADQQHRRRARIIGAGHEECGGKISILQKEPFCHWCCVKLTNRIGRYVLRVTDRTVDHVIPLMRGGSHAPDNLVAACRACNSSKNDKLISEWRWEAAK